MKHRGSTVVVSEKRSFGGGGIMKGITKKLEGVEEPSNKLKKSVQIANSIAFEVSEEDED